MGAAIGIVAGLALLGMLSGRANNGPFLQRFHENRMDRVHNRAEARAHRQGRPGPYTIIRYEQPKPVRTYHVMP